MHLFVLYPALGRLLRALKYIDLDLDLSTSAIMRRKVKHTASYNDDLMNKSRQKIYCLSVCLSFSQNELTS